MANTLKDNMTDKEYSKYVMANSGDPSAQLLAHQKIADDRYGKSPVYGQPPMVDATGEIGPTTIFEGAATPPEVMPFMGGNYLDRVMYNDEANKASRGQTTQGQVQNGSDLVNDPRNKKSGALPTGKGPNAKDDDQQKQEVAQSEFAEKFNYRMENIPSFNKLVTNGVSFTGGIADDVSRGFMPDEIGGDYIRNYMEEFRSNQRVKDRDQRISLGLEKPTDQERSGALQSGGNSDVPGEEYAVTPQLNWNDSWDVAKKKLDDMPNLQASPGNQEAAAKEGYKWDFWENTFNQRNFDLDDAGEALRATSEAVIGKGATAAIADPIDTLSSNVDAVSGALGGIEEDIRGTAVGGAILGAADKVADVPISAYKYTQDNIIDPEKFPAMAVEGMVDTINYHKTNPSGLAYDPNEEGIPDERRHDGGKNRKGATKPALLTGDATTGSAKKTVPGDVSDSAQNAGDHSIGAQLASGPSQKDQALEATEKAAQKEEADQQAQQDEISVVKAPSIVSDVDKYKGPTSVSSEEDDSKTSNPAVDNANTKIKSFEDGTLQLYQSGAARSKLLDITNQEEDEVSWYEDGDFWSGVGNFFLGLLLSGGNPAMAMLFASHEYDQTKARNKRESLVPSLRKRGKTEESIIAYVETGEPSVLENMSAEMRQESLAKSAHYDAYLDERGALIESKKDVGRQAYLEMSKEEADVSIAESNAQMKKYEADLQSQLSPEQREEYKMFTEQFDREMQVANLSKQGQASATAELARRMKIIADLEKSDGLSQRFSVAAMLAGLGSAEAKQGKTFWNLTYGQRLKNPETGEMEYQRYPLTGLFGDVYQTTGESTIPRVVFDTISVALSKDDKTGVESSHVDKYKSTAAFEEKLRDSGDYSDDQILAAKRAYANEMDFILGINKGRRMSKDEYIAQRNIYFPSTGDNHDQMVQAAVRRNNAVVLLHTAAGKQGLGKKLDQESASRVIQFGENLVADDWRSTGKTGGDSFVLSDKTRDWLAQEPYNIDTVEGKFYNYETIVEHLIVAGREDDLKFQDKLEKVKLQQKQEVLDTVSNLVSETKDREQMYAPNPIYNK